MKTKLELTEKHMRSFIYDYFNREFEVKIHEDPSGPYGGTFRSIMVTFSGTFFICTDPSLTSDYINQWEKTLSDHFKTEDFMRQYTQEILREEIIDELLDE